MEESIDLENIKLDGEGMKIPPVVILKKPVISNPNSVINSRLLK